MCPFAYRSLKSGFLLSTKYCYTLSISPSFHSSFKCIVFVVEYNCCYLCIKFRFLLLRSLRTEIRSLFRASVSFFSSFYDLFFCSFRFSFCGGYRVHLSWSEDLTKGTLLLVKCLFQINYAYKPCTFQSIEVGFPYNPFLLFK